MKSTTRLALAALCGLSILSPTFAQEAQPKVPAQIESDLEKFQQAGQESYIYGLGIVAMYRYYSGMALQEGGLNKLVHSRSFLNPGDKPGGEVNVDTYYSYGWFDLSEEPMVVSLPAFGDRYYVYQLNDIYGRNFHNIGNGLSGESPESYKGPITFVLTPPDWKGEIPPGVEEVKSPGKLVNVLYRIRVSDEAKEGEAARKLQDQSLSLPLSAWVKGERKSIQVKPKTQLGPMEDVLVYASGATGKDQRHPDYFAQLGKVLSYDAPNTKADQKFLKETLSKIGFAPDGSFDFEALSPKQQAALLDAQQAGHDEVLAFIPKRGIAVGTAMFTSEDAGNYGSDWRLRAAMVFAGAMYPTIEVSRYADFFTDSKGEPLKGENTYTLKFEKGGLPPVTSFWSATVYGQGSFDIIANPINRYMINEETPGLQYGEDGSLTLTLSNKKPAEAANWLPTPEGAFYLKYRFYAPKKPVIDLTYHLPDLVLK
ncbi:DUF1254 domain-containing protein [Haloferula sp.]|uniref:DUF1254 domain-containing protein n=1 Tax=Haloferula sp. TaxID=2497595 RepID=UPI00329B3271